MLPKLPGENDNNDPFSNFNENFTTLAKTTKWSALGGLVVTLILGGGLLYVIVYAIDKLAR